MLAFLLSAALAAAPALGSLRTVATFTAPEGAAPLGEPAGVVTDAFGHVWATDAASHRLVRWDADGRWLGESGALGSDENQFRRPTSLARLGSLGVAVLDVDNRRVLAFDQLGRRTDLVVALDAPELEQQVGRVLPVALAADRGAALWVADGDRDRVLAFDFSGRYVRTVGSYGTAPGAFHGLAAIAVAAHGELVTLERAVPAPRRKKGAPADSSARGLAARVQWLDAGGAPVGGWTIPEAATGDVAIAVDDSDRVAVVIPVAGGDEVRLYTRDGTLLVRTADAQRPRALAFAPDGTLLVAEAGAARVRRFRLEPRRGE